MRRVFATWALALVTVVTGAGCMSKWRPTLTYHKDKYPARTAIADVVIVPPYLVDAVYPKHQVLGEVHTKDYGEMREIAALAGGDVVILTAFTTDFLSGHKDVELIGDAIRFTGDDPAADRRHLLDLVRKVEVERNIEVDPRMNPMP
jgi:hypothetical protein